MKVLTLHEPWASLVALEIKTCETRSWKAPDALIGQRIALHAAAKKPTEDQRVGDWTVHEMAGGSWAMTVDDKSATVRLPLGCIVATARLDACAPMIDLMTGEPEDLLGQSPAIYVGPDTLTLSHHFEVPARHTDISDQLPYGDFRPGRWAWLLADITPLDPPVPFIGGQGLTKTWEPS